MIQLGPCCNCRCCTSELRGKKPKGGKRQGRDQGSARRWLLLPPLCPLPTPVPVPAPVPLVEALPLRAFASGCPAPISLYLCQFIKREWRYLAQISSVVSQPFDIIKLYVQMDILIYRDSCSPV